MSAEIVPGGRRVLLPRAAGATPGRAVAGGEVVEFGGGRPAGVPVVAVRRRRVVREVWECSEIVPVGVAAGAVPVLEAGRGRAAGPGGRGPRRGSPAVGVVLLVGVVLVWAVAVAAVLLLLVAGALSGADGRAVTGAGVPGLVLVRAAGCCRLAACPVRTLSHLGGAGGLVAASASPGLPAVAPRVSPRVRPVLVRAGAATTHDDIDAARSVR